MVFGFIGGALAGIGLSFFQPLQQATKRHLNSLTPLELLSATVYADAYRLGHITKESYYAYCKEIGLSRNQALLNYRASDSFLTTEQLAVHRIQSTMNEVLSYYDNNPDGTFKQSALDDIKNQYRKEMFGIGFTKERADDIFESLRPVPSFSIILEWLAKEAFEPTVIDRFNLTADYPKIFDSLLEGLGVPGTERDKYWIAHWNHLSNGQMVEMYQRFRADRTDYDQTILDDIGSDFDSLKMTQADLEEALKLNELAPYWRARLQAITYKPLPFTLLQGAYQYGLETDDWFLGRLKDYGYSAGDSQKILNFWQIKYPYNSRRPLEDNVVLKLRRGIITKAQAIQLLKTAGVDPTSAEIVAGITQDRVDFENEKALISAWRKGYNKKAWTDVQLRNLINAKITDAGRQTLIFNLITNQEPGAFTRLRISDVRRGYEDGNITKEQAQAQLMDMRLLDADIAFFFELYSPDEDTSSDTEAPAPDE